MCSGLAFGKAADHDLSWSCATARQTGSEMNFALWSSRAEQTVVVKGTSVVRPEPSQRRARHQALDEPDWRYRWPHQQHRQIPGRAQQRQAWRASEESNPKRRLKSPGQAAPSGWRARVPDRARVAARYLSGVDELIAPADIEIDIGERAETWLAALPKGEGAIRIRFDTLRLTRRQCAHSMCALRSDYHEHHPLR